MNLLSEKIHKSSDKENPELGQTVIDGASKQFSAQTWISASIILVMVALGSKCVGFIRDILVAKYFGADQRVDAFMVALSLPMLVGGGIGFALSSSLVPMYRKVLSNSGVQKANKLAGAVVTSGTVLSILLMIPIYLAPNFLVKLIAPSLSDATIVLAAKLARWLSLYVIGLILTFILTAVYHGFHHFIIPAFSDLAFNISLILVLLIFVLPLGIYALVFGYISAAFLCVFILILFLLKNKPPGFRINLREKELKNLIAFAIPIFFLDFSLQFGTVIENYFASGLDEGTIAALNYAKKLFIAVIGLVGVNISRGIFPSLSEMYSENERDRARDLFVKLNKQLIVAFIPLTTLVILLRKQIIALIFMRGAFDAIALDLTSNALLFYSVGLFVGAIEPIFLRACYAFSDTIVPLFSVIISILLLVPLNLILVPILGIGGIALATNIAFLLRVLIQGISLRRKLGGLSIAEMLKTFIKSLVCSLIAIGPILLLPKHKTILLPLDFLLYFLSYLIVGWFFMNKEVVTMIKLLKQGLRMRST